jgi:hypothetical protein
MAVASDELDWSMHYLLVGLYFEDEQIRGPTRLASHTDPLDAWVLHQHGMRTTPAPKPSMRVDKKSRTFIDRICDERPPGRMSAAGMLLDVNGEARKRLWKAIDNAALGATTGASATVHIGLRVGTRSDDDLCDRGTQRAGGASGDVLDELVGTRVQEHGLQRVLGIGTTVGSTQPLRRAGCSRPQIVGATGRYSVKVVGLPVGAFHMRAPRRGTAPLRESLACVRAAAGGCQCPGWLTRRALRVSLEHGFRAHVRGWPARSGSCATDCGARPPRGCKRSRAVSDVVGMAGPQVRSAL